MTVPAGPAPPSYEPLLDQLLHASEPVGIDHLALALHVTASAAIKQLQRLQAMGCTLESHPQHGVRLQQTSLATWVDYLRWRDHRAGRGERTIEVYRRTASTQDVVRRMIAHQGPAAHGAVAIADEQTAGRGRQGNRWIAPAGSAVLFSLAWVQKAAAEALSIDRIMFASAVAIARALEASTGSPASPPLKVEIKWPNDLLVGRRKIAGILVETFPVRDTWAAVIGVGINVDLRPAQLPPEDKGLARRLTSLAMLDRHVDRLRVLPEAIAALDDALGQTDPRPLVEQWRRRCAILTHHVRLRHDSKLIRGQVVDLDPYEGLIVRADSGEIMHLPAATTTLLHDDDQ